MNFTTSITRRQLAGFFIAVTMSTSALSQDSDFSELELAIDTAENTLSELDSKASTCLNSFSMNLGEAAALLCDEFMRAIDGELLSNYISNCNSLKAWRDEFVAARSENPDIASQDSENIALDLMVATEFTCGEGALQKRTNYVVQAFETLNRGTLLNNPTSQSLENRIAQQELESRLRREQNALRSSVQNSFKQREQATQQQMNALENELIRQQINKPNP